MKFGFCNVLSLTKRKKDAKSLWTPKVLWETWRCLYFYYESQLFFVCFFYKDMNICDVIFFVTPEHILVFERDLRIIDADLLIILFYLYRLCLRSYILVTTHKGSIVFALLRIHIPIQELIKAKGPQKEKSKEQLSHDL